MKTAVLVLLLVFGVVSMSEAACVQEVGGALTAILNWTTTDATDSVVVSRGTVSGGPYTKLASLPAGTTTYTDTVAAPSGTISYFYVVDLVSAQAGPGPNSNEVCKTFFGIPPAPALSIQ